jgi:rhamnose transport system permease protein
VSAAGQGPAAALGEQEPAVVIPSTRRLVDIVLRARTLGIVVVLVLMVGITTAFQSRFLGISNIQFVLKDTSLFALLALGETLVVLTRNVDLSVGAVLGLAAWVSANTFAAHPHTSIVVDFLIGIGVGAACGSVTGLLVAVGQIPSLVVTLAMLYIIRGTDVLVAHAGQVAPNQLPNGFLHIYQSTVGGIPTVAIAIAVGAVIVAFYLRSFRSGRDLYAIGSDPQAARLAGIPIARRVFMAFVLSGALAGIAGVLYASQYQYVDATAGTGYELQVIASVVVGGVAIFGGSGTAIGAALGALVLNTITTALNVLGISPFWQQAISGFLLLAAISADRGIQLQLAAALRRRRVHLGA